MYLKNNNPSPSSHHTSPSFIPSSTIITSFIPSSIIHHHNIIYPFIHHHRTWVVIRRSPSSVGRHHLSVAIIRQSLPSSVGHSNPLVAAIIHRSSSSIGRHTSVWSAHRCKRQTTQNTTASDVNLPAFMF